MQQNFLCAHFCHSVFRYRLSYSSDYYETVCMIEIVVFHIFNCRTSPIDRPDQELLMESDKCTCAVAFLSRRPTSATNCKDFISNILWLYAHLLLLHSS